MSINKNKSFEELKEEGICTNALINELERKNYKALENSLNSTERSNKDIMVPILYAVKKEHKTYEVYEFWGEDLQSNVELARDVIIGAPDLIGKTKVSENKDFILQATQINPKVIAHMSDNLKKDVRFAEQLCQLGNREIVSNVVKECKMPDTIKESLLLAGSMVVMQEAIKQDPNALEYASDELKNNYDFMKEISSNNKNVIEYVAKNASEFGSEGLTAAKESLVEISSEEAISGFKEEEEALREKTSQEGAISEEDLKRKKQLQRHIKLFESIKSGERDPVRAAKLIKRLCKDLDPEYIKEIDQLVKIDDVILERQEKDKGYTNKNVESITTGVELTGYNKETLLTAKGVRGAEQVDKTSGTQEH